MVLFYSRWLFNLPEDVTVFILKRFLCILNYICSLVGGRANVFATQSDPLARGMFVPIVDHSWLVLFAVKGRCGSGSWHTLHDIKCVSLFMHQ